MQYKNLFGSIVLTILVIMGGAQSAHALSCLPTDMYLKDVVGKEEIVIFTATSRDRMDKEDYTAEVLTVVSAKQGYVEQEVFAYHEKDSTWGYLCNAGPKEKGSTGVYVAYRDEAGKYTIRQRLETNDPLVATLDADIKKAGVEGNIAELSRTDRMNQIHTTIGDLLREIGILLNELVYWESK